MEKWLKEQLREVSEEKQERMIALYHIGKEFVVDGEFKESYRMPAFYLHGKPVFYFTLAKQHLGFYPTPSPIEKVKKELEEGKWKFSKGAVQLPYSRELPTELIQKMIQYRIEEIENRNG